MPIPNWVCTFRQLTNTGEALTSPSSVLTFPINPEAYSIDAGRGLEEVSIIGHRDIPRMGSRRLNKLTFDALLPGSYDPSLCNYEDIPKSTDAEARLRRWAQGRPLLAPLRVTIAGLYTDTMVLTDCRTSTRPAEEDGDIWVSLSLTQWVVIRPRSWSYARPVRRPPATSSNAIRYTIVSGDTLWGIARRFYGQGSEWRRIWERNAPMTSGNPNLIYPGEVVIVPKK